MISRLVRRVQWLVRRVQRNAWGSLGGLLLVALAVTAGGREWAVHRIETHPDTQRTAVVEAAVETVERRFARLRNRVQGQAKRVAVDSVVVQALRAWREQGTRPAALSRHLLDLPLNDRTTVEVYTPMPRVLAWHGQHMPLGEAPDAEAFLQRPQMAIVDDGTVRRALVAWRPVRANGEVLGAVRVVRMIRFQPPVQNRYVQSFSLQKVWERETGESLRLTWSAPPTSLDRPHHVLRGPNDVLGYVTVVPPSTERLAQRTAAVYNDLLAGWAVLLLGWVVWGVGQWYFRLAARPGVRRHAGARAAAAGRLACAAAVWVGVRYLLLALDVPARWLGHVPGVSVLFDPTRFASMIGGGVFRSIGDLFLSGVWAAGLAAVGLHLALRFRPRASSVRALVGTLQRHDPARPSSGRFVGLVVGLVGIALGSVLGLAYVVRRAVLDSTLNFFSRTGLLPEPLVMIVLSALVLLVVAVVLFGVACTWVGLRLGLRYRPAWPQGLVPTSVVVFFALGVAGLYLGTDAQVLVPFPYPLGVMGVVTGTAIYGMVGRNGGAEIFTVRGLLLALLAVTLLFYPLLYAGMDAQRRERMVEAIQSFEEGYDPRALYSIRQTLRAADEALAPRGDRPFAARVDSVAAQVVRRSLLASLTTYEVSLSLLDADGTLLRRYGASGRQPLRSGLRRADRAVFDVLRQVYARQPSPEPVIDRLAGDRGVVRAGERFQYAGLLRFGNGEGGWVLIRAEPRSILPGTGAGVPRVLLPDGSFSDLYAEMSMAAFQDGTITRSYGESFGRTTLPAAVAAALDDEGHLWRSQTIQGRRYLTYYHRPSAEESTIVAARIPSILAFDHLYYLLRLTVAGLGVGLVVYLLALYGRYRHGLVPARRVRFRNKVLNAFLSVGIVSMAAVGVVGVQVVTGENKRVVERRLRDQLTRVEETLSLEARPDEPLWQAAARMDVDSLAARVGLDLRVYEGGQLVGTSRPRLVRDGLVDERLPGTVHHQLYNESYRFAAADATLGRFRYRVGYQALVDDQGRPRLVVGVPTLAQQEQVAEEQARTLAYLFGALLVLFVVVMLTAVILASALARPIARLREGLEAVGEGRFAEALPVDTRDEIGDLVRTFNEMRAQLAESRRKLAQQEREIAWREMARQVAHEIKNPLTPMKLSIQHLRRAFEGARADGEGDTAFTDLFDRITSTLIEQIESLVRIANEFSTFARLPTRVPEPLDLNEVIEEAVHLMGEDAEAGTIELDLHAEPLVVKADREELRRTYINLLKNALQALPDDREGRVRVTTTLRNGPDGPTVESQVVDNGTGIPPAVRDKIFEPNFSTKTSGTGLGLAIAQKSIDELGGTIGYETEEGEGTTFWVRLPPAEEREVKKM
ncbi:MAG: ATP-binding protein [Salinibacter sp.]